jgi:hypothetical protein
MLISDLKELNQTIEYFSNDIKLIVNNDEIFEYFDKKILFNILNKMNYSNYLTNNNKKELLQILFIMYKQYI